MLDLMRKHARNWLMKLILGIIIIVFVFYFGSMGGRQRAERIAMIDGKPIVEADFQREYQKLADMYRQRFGQALTEEMLKSLNLKKQAHDSLIDQAVILLKAEQMDIRVTDEDVKALILTYPGFQRDGAFNQRIYEQVLRSNKMTPDEFEDLQRKMLIAMRVEDLIRDGISVPDQEVRDLFEMQNEKLNIDFIALAPNSFQAGIKPATADLEAYLKGHEVQFRVPEQLQIRYLAFPGQDYAAAAQVSDTDVAEAYERRKAQWTKDNKVQPLAEVRDRIVAELKFAQGMYRAADEAKKAHDTIYQNENFDGYAAQKGLPVRSTGLFRLSEPPPEFRPIPDFVKIVSSLQKKEISRVLQGNNGYYLVTVAERKAPYLPALKEIEAEVDRQYREQEAKRLAQKEAEALLARLRKGEPFEAVAREKGLKITETGLFQPGGGAVPKIGSSAELSQALFEVSEKKPYLEKVYMVDGNVVIVKFKARSKVSDEEFAAQKEQIAKYLAQEKKSEAVRAWIEASKTALVKEGRLTYTRDLKDL